MQKDNTKALLIISSLFFVFGFITWLNAALIPFLKIACELTNFESYFVTFAFYIAYFVFAIPSSWLLKKTGFKEGMGVGLWIMAVGALIFIPAAYARSYVFFLTGLFLLGAGLALLQTAANPYVAVIGPIETAARRISIMGIFNKIAGALAPWILGSVVLSQTKVTEQILSSEHLHSLSPEQIQTQLDSLARLCVPPYIAITVGLFALAVLIRKVDLPEINLNESSEKEASQVKIPAKKHIWQYPHLMFGVIALFFYVGAEVISIDSLMGYAIENGVAPSYAKSLPMYSMFALIIGYVVGIVSIPRVFSQRIMLLISAALGIIFTLVALFTSTDTSLLALVLLGFANAMVWPGIWGLALEGLGKHTNTGSSLLIMAIAGGAILPLVYGKLADFLPSVFENMTNGSALKWAYLILLPSYFIIGLYAVFVNKTHRKN